MTRLAEEQKRRIVDAARAIIRETGNLDLPMRALCSRAKVSMTAPYALFGSKSGLVAALLAGDQVRFAEKRSVKKSADLIEEHFDSLRIGMDFYASNQSFYRALFRLTQDGTHDGQDPTRLNHKVFLRRMEAAKEAGFLRVSTNVEAFTEVLTDLFSAGVKAWAAGTWDIEQLYARLGYGYSIALAGAATPKTSARMIAQANEFEALLAKLVAQPAPRQRATRAKAER